MCFGVALPSPIVERVLELRIEQTKIRYRNGIYKDGRLHGKWEWRCDGDCCGDDDGPVWYYEANYQNGLLIDKVTKILMLPRSNPPSEQPIK